MQTKFKLLFKYCANMSSGGGGQSANRSAQIKNEIIDNIKLPGIKRKAENGEGNYSWVKNKPISENEAQKIDRIEKIYDKGNYTVIDGVLNGKGVYFAASNSNPTVLKAKQKMEEKKQKHNERIERDRQSGLESLVDRHATANTSTYEKWRKRNSANYEAYYYGIQNKKKSK